ncbi:hypothetical protein AQI88_38880 [Streptomyces cellostaticus]|uniref:TIR domain-containing protein n=1 Tax=Streptomyces cellostaticus TaxID=67285 RepID=A0A101NBV5_9ACTN|nr:hypothetical protein AQI88_38880 [Streptomyces cellostaticus]GHI04262.1 hypothetical protein Scel_25830 [Streptomyces cellostaticus]
MFGGAGGGPCDAFFSYARTDRERVLPVVEGLRAAGLKVFLDETGIDEFEGITPAIQAALAQARLFVAFYSTTYPTRPACQWELLTAFRAATALGEASQRILVVNPEERADHIEPVELRDARYATVGGEEALGRLVERLRAKAGQSTSPLGDAVVQERPVWRPAEHTGSPRFVGRVTEFWQLHSYLHALEYAATHDEASAGQAVIAGLGGMGKTLLAEQYAHRFGSFYPGGIYWFAAAASHDPGTNPEEAQEEARAQHHQQIARIFGIDPAQATLEEIRETARRHIEQTGKPCLWVVDDIPGRLPLEVVRELACPHPLGRTVMTTRWRGYQLPAVDVDVLPRDEAWRLLTSARAPAGLEEEAAAGDLVGALGCHALAVDLARGCIADQPSLTYQQLRADLADTQHGDAFQDLVDDIEAQVPTGHTRDIAATFTRSLSRLDRAALTLMRAAAVLARAPIPEALLHAITAEATGSEDTDTDRALRRALSAVQRLSVIRQDSTDPPTWSVHALVARTLLLQRQSSAAWQVLCTAVVAATTRLMKQAYSPGRLDHLAAIAPHARALTDLFDTPNALDLLEALARYDYKTGQPTSAAHHYVRLEAAQSRIIGPDHPRTLETRNALAGAYEQAGRLSEAIPLYQRTLADRERVLGPDHPDTLISRNNLAYAYRVAGRLDDAIPLLKRTLADMERVLGPDHPSTLHSRNNLAYTYEAAERLDEAIPLYQRTLADRERVLGPDHPDTLISRNNLAFAYLGVERPDEAVPLFERILADAVLVLGPDHPDTLAYRGNLGRAYREAGRLEEAMPLLQSALVDMERVLGPDHPDTLTSRNNLAYGYEAAGRLDKAVPLYQQTLAGRKRVLGPDHPDTLAAGDDLAYAYQGTGRLDEAIQLFRQTLDDAVRVLGWEHPLTNTINRHHAFALVKQLFGEHIAPRDCDRAPQPSSGEHISEGDIEQSESSDVQDDPEGEADDSGTDGGREGG